MAARRNASSKQSKHPTSDTKQQCAGIAFEINLEPELERPPSAGPGRLRQRAPRAQPTLQEVEEKQRRAEERRKAVEAEKLQKIQIREENSKKVTQKMEKVVKRLPDALEKKGPEKPFDEDEVVPALKHKMLDEKIPSQKNPKGTVASKKSNAKSVGKNVKKSSKSSS